MLKVPSHFPHQMLGLCILNRNKFYKLDLLFWKPVSSELVPMLVTSCLVDQKAFHHRDSCGSKYDFRWPVVKTVPTNTERNLLP